MNLSTTEILEIDGEEIGMSVRELALDTGIPQKELRQYFRGSRELTGMDERAIRIAVYGDSPAMRAAEGLKDCQTISVDFSVQPNHSEEPECQYVDIHHSFDDGLCLNKMDFDYLESEYGVVLSGVYLDMEKIDGGHRLWFRDSDQ